MNRNLSRGQIVNLSGILLAVFAFFFGPWLGSRSGMWIWLDLAGFLSGTHPPADTSRQETIFLLLTVLFLLLAGQAATMFKMARTMRPRWAVFEIVLALAALGVLSVLYLGYDAQTLGVSLTALGCVLIGGSGLALFVGHAPGAGEEVPRPSLEEAQRMPPQPIDDPMLAFQKAVAAEFHRCERENAPFSLSVIGMAHHDDYVTVFGEQEGEELTTTLLADVRHVCPTAIAVGFSSGAVMVALPNVAADRVTGIVAETTSRMRSRGFVGEMLLPGGKMQLINGAATYPLDANNLADLTERALLAYAEASAAIRGEVEDDRADLRAREDDSIPVFQRDATVLLRECQRDLAPFSLCVIGVAYYDTYVSVFGQDAERDLTLVLLDTVRELCPTCIAACFSVGAVIAALPDPADRVHTMIEAVAERMRSHSSVGDLVLPGEQLELISGVASLPLDGHDLEQLTEEAMTAYGEALARAKTG